MSIETAEQVDSSSVDGQGNVLPGATEAEQKTINEIRDAETRLVDLAVATLDPKDMLKKYAKLGAETLKVARKRKASIKAGAWTKEDLSKVFSDLTLLIKMRVAIKHVELDKYVRVHMFVEAMRPLVPNIEKLSFHQAVNKFIPTLSFDAVELTGEVQKGWLTWVRETLEIQLSDSPMSMKDLDASIAEQKAAILKARNSKRTPEQQDEIDRKAAESKVRKERKDAQSKVADSVDKAIVDGHATGDDIAGIVEVVLKEHGIEMPKMGFDPATATISDCKLVADVMFTTGRVAEMKYLRDRLDAMIKIAENAMVTSASA